MNAEAVQNQLNVNPNRSKIIAIASGKGGVGKTSFTLNLCRTLTKQGKRVLVFDADLGLGNIDVQLGLNPDQDLSQVVRGRAMLSEIITKTPLGFDIIPGRSGSEDLPFVTSLEQRNILKDLRTIAANYDVVFLDIAAGINEEVLSFARFADDTLMVVTPDPSSITDAYAVVKLLKNRHGIENCRIMVNQATSQLEGEQTFEKLHTAGKRFLGVHLPLIGIMPQEREYMTAVRMQKIAVDAFPHTKVAETFDAIARKVSQL